MDGDHFSQVVQKNCFTDRTLPVSVSTEALAWLWERRAGAGGLLGGAPGDELPRLLDSRESRARDNDDDLLIESLLALLRGSERFIDSRLVSRFPLPLFGRLLFSDSRLESRVLVTEEPRSRPTRLASLCDVEAELCLEVERDLRESRLSFRR